MPLAPLRSGLILGVLAVCASFAHAHAHSAQSGGIAIGHIWAPAIGADTHSINVYGPFLNKGTIADAITGIKVEGAIVTFCKKADGIIVCAPWRTDLELPPGKPATLNANTQFLKLDNLENFGAGDKHPITFYFRHAAPVTMDIVAEAMGKPHD